MRTLRLWLLFWLLPLIAPLAWAQVGSAMPSAAPPCPAHRAMATPAEPPQAVNHVGHQTAPQAAAHTDSVQAKRPPVRHLPCGDCSACHAVALLPPSWQLDEPELVEATPGWHADLGQGRPEGCELYRPPRA